MWGTCLVARLRVGQHMDGLAGIARPNHARKAPTKKVVQLLLQLLPLKKTRQRIGKGRSVCASHVSPGRSKVNRYDFQKEEGPCQTQKHWET